jgi:hypothetical protein
MRSRIKIIIVDIDSMTSSSFLPTKIKCTRIDQIEFKKNEDRLNLILEP